MTPPAEANPPKQKGIYLRKTHDEQDRQSAHQFPDPREGELWDHLGITEAIWKKCEAEDPEALDLGDVYISSTSESMITTTMISQLKDLHSRDRPEQVKIHKY